MSVLALAGWLLAGAAIALLGLERLRAAAVREQVVRACHELRNPLHAAGLALHGAPSTGRVRAACAELDRAAAALAVLDGTAGRRGVGRVDVGALVARHAPAWRAVAGAHGARLDVRVPARPAVAVGDPGRLAQAAANLVANAVEHGGGEVAVQVRTDHGDVVLEVRDRGPGLPAPLPDLAGRARAGRGRRGRGLAIAAEVAADHGGRLAAADDGEGATVRLALPRAA